MKNILLLKMGGEDSLKNVEKSLEKIIIKKTKGKARDTRAPKAYAKKWVWAI